MVTNILEKNNITMNSDKSLEKQYHKLLEERNELLKSKAITLYEKSEMDPTESSSNHQYDYEYEYSDDDGYEHFAKKPFHRK